MPTMHSPFVHQYVYVCEELVNDTIEALSHTSSSPFGLVFGPAQGDGAPPLPLVVSMNRLAVRMRGFSSFSTGSVG